jgi:hypothetical protein
MVEGSSIFRSYQRGHSSNENTSNAHLKQILSQTLDQTLALLEAGEPLVEISGD